MGKQGKKVKLPKKPFVSICTPTYNRRPFIPAIIKCIENQDYPKEKIEWIIIDDGKDKIEDLVSHIPYVKYFKFDKKMTLGKKRNISHEKSKGDILLFLNSDDFIADNKIIDKSMELFKKGFDIVYGDISYFNYKNQKRVWRSFKPGKYYKNAYQNGWHAPHPAFFIKKKIHKKIF